MPVNTQRLRIVFMAVAAVLVAAVIGFYSYARHRVSQAIKEVPQKLGIDVQQSAHGFKVTKSEGGHILFSLSASSAVQFKGAQRSQLKDARIIVYNHGKGTSDLATDIFDQIYGKQFDYDHETGEIKAEGEVLIDLQSKGMPPEDPAQTTSNPGALHLKTSGLTFNEKTGVAETDQLIEFSLPQGNGSAVGAVYDSKLMSLHLKSKVQIKTTASARNNPVSSTITADNADIFDMPREAIISGVQLEDAQSRRRIHATRMTVELRDDNTVEKIVTENGVTAEFAATDKSRTKIAAQKSELSFGPSNDLKTAVLLGAVNLDSQSASKGNLHATAGRADLEFGEKEQLKKIHATQQVNVSDSSAKQDSFALHSPAVDFFLKAGNMLEKAVTDGASEVVMDSKPSASQKNGSHAVITADTFEAGFNPGGAAKLQSVHGSGHTKVVSSSAGYPDRITTGKDLQVKFDAKSGNVTNVDQTGDFKYVEGQRDASADYAHLDLSADQLTLNGSPRLQDQSQGFTLTANVVTVNRKTGDVKAAGQVKATYNQSKGNASGALFSNQSGEPVHATSQTLTANKETEIARFSGGARLWQGANLIDAPTITFDQQKRNLTAEGKGPGQVQTAFVQRDKKGKVTPVSATGGKLVYSDSDRKARFYGGVKLKTTEAMMVAEQADLFLKAKAAQPVAQHDSAGQIERVEATGNIEIQELDPVRQVTGSRLVYTADEGKFVMTGEPGKPPSIFDAERGNLTGDSLTFYIHDDRVQVGSGENARVVTRTRIKDEKKP